MANPNMRKGMPSVNPKGRPPGIIHTLDDKRNRFLETLTRGEILALAADDERLDREYRAFDAQVIIGLADTLKRTPEEKLDPSLERARLYDRTIGKAAQTVNVDHTGSVTVFSVDLSPTLAFLEGDGEESETITIEGIAPESHSDMSGLEQNRLVLSSAVRAEP